MSTPFLDHLKRLEPRARDYALADAAQIRARTDAGEPLSTSAAELGYTPPEGRDLLTFAKWTARQRR